MHMRDILGERALDGSKSYPYEFIGASVDTHEFGDTGGRLPHPVEKKKYCFDSDNGLHYIVHCNLANHELEASFTVVGGKIHVNGRGDAFKVLGTVSKIVGDYCRADPPRAIIFTADMREPSRVKLYDFMCANADRFFPGYSLEARTKFGRSIKYRMARPLTQADADRDAQDAAERAKPKPPAPPAVPEPETDTRTPEQKRRAYDRLDAMLAGEDEELLRLLGLHEAPSDMRRLMTLIEAITDRDEYWRQREAIEKRAQRGRIDFNIATDDYRKTGDEAHLEARREALQAFRAADAEMRAFCDANPEPGHSTIKPDAPEAHVSQSGDQGSQGDDYRGQHQAPDHEGGAPLWDLTGNGIYPKDVYERWYEYLNDPDERRVVGTVLDFQGKPNRPVMIYRAMPKSVPSKINPGDWVSTSKAYCRDHGRSALNGDYKIVQKTVRARDLFTEGNSLLEWGYDPQPMVKYERGTKPRFDGQR